MVNEIIIRFPFKDRTEEIKMKVTLTSEDMNKIKDAAGMSIKIKVKQSETGTEKVFTVAIDSFNQIDGKVIAIPSESSVNEIEDFVYGKNKGL
jgi:hypothetical protein